MPLICPNCEEEHDCVTYSENSSSWGTYNPDYGIDINESESDNYEFRCTNCDYGYNDSDEVDTLFTEFEEKHKPEPVIPKPLTAKELNNKAQKNYDI